MIANRSARLAAQRNEKVCIEQAARVGTANGPLLVARERTVSSRALSPPETLMKPSRVSSLRARCIVFALSTIASFEGSARPLRAHRFILSKAGLHPEAEPATSARLGRLAEQGCRQAPRPTSRELLSHQQGPRFYSDPRRTRAGFGAPKWAS